jgi:hypothetical protein
MNFNPVKGVLQIDPDEAKRAAAYLLYAIKKIKVGAKLPLTPYKQENELSQADHAMHGILEGASALGLDLGARWGNEIDSTNHN